MINWQNIHPLLTAELAQEWKNFNFSAEECKEWIDAGFGEHLAGFCAWLKFHKQAKPLEVLNGELGALDHLWTEYNNYLLEISFVFNPSKLDLTSPLTDFTSELATNTEEFSSSIAEPVPASEQNIFSLALKSPAQEWLDQNYPENGVCQRESVLESNKGKTRAQITHLDISQQNLVGELNLTGFTQLKVLSCQDNQLTSLDYSVLNPQHLTKLDISNNNLLRQDLTVFSQLVNLKFLRIGNTNSDKIKQGIYNRFFGSLAPLQPLTTLWSLDISNTDLNGGVECLPTSIKKYLYYDISLRLDCQLTEITWKLKLFVHRDLAKLKKWQELGFTEEEIKFWLGIGCKVWEYNFVEKWQALGFTLQQVKEWLTAGLETHEYNLANYLKTEKNLTPQKIGNDLGQLREEGNTWMWKNTYHVKEADITKFNLAEAGPGRELIPYEQFSKVEYLAKRWLGRSP